MYTTFTATPGPQSESAFVLLGTGNRSVHQVLQAQWPAPGSAVEGRYTPADIPVNPIFFRDRVNAAKQGSPPRGVPR
jgi:hypothetical protein